MQRSYEIRIDYGRDTGSREFFENVADLMLGLDRLNNALAKSFSEEIDIEATILEIDGGSIRVKMRDMIERVPDEKIRNYVKNPREAIADLLVGLKYKLLKMLRERPAQIEREITQVVEAEIERSPLRAFGYRFHKTQALEAMSEISKSAGKFEHRPLIEIMGERVEIIDGYSFDPERAEGIEHRVSQFRALLTIKKPDLTGESMWELIFDKTIRAKIEDRDFIDRIRRREISIAHGDMLDAEMRIETFIDPEEMSVVETRYYIERVYDIVPPLDKKNKELPL